MELSLLFSDKKTVHDDLTLRFADKDYVCDSYYLVIDRNLLPGREDAYKIRVVLRSLLAQWRNAVENVADGNNVYLPYDFSDQYTAWLRCSRSGDQVTLYRGWAELEGWAISPSAIGDCINDLPDFRPDGPCIEMSILKLIDAIQESYQRVSG